jgi:hypothetical protein
MLQTVALFRLPAVECVAVHYLKYFISFVKKGASKKQKKNIVLMTKTTNTHVVKKDLDMTKKT